MFFGLMVEAGGMDAKLRDVRENKNGAGEADGFRQVFAKAVDEARGGERQAVERSEKPERADSKTKRPEAPKAEKAERSEAKAAEQSGSESSTARGDEAGRTEREPAESKDELQVASKLLREIVHRLEQEKGKAASEAQSEEELIAMMMNLIALLLSGAQEDRHAFLEKLGLASPGEQVVDLKFMGAEELLDALREMLEAAGIDTEAAQDNLKLLVRVGENEAVAIPLKLSVEQTGEAEEGTDGRIVLNLMADAAGEKLSLVIDAECAAQAELTTLDAEVPGDADLLLALAAAPQEELLGQGEAASEAMSVSELLESLAMQESPTPRETKSRPQSVTVALQVQGEAGDAGVRSLRPEVRDFLQALLNRVSDAQAPGTANEGVATANAEFLASDEYLKVLEWLSFLQNAAAKPQGKAFGEKLAGLLDGNLGGQPMTLSDLLLMHGGQPGARLVESLLEDTVGEDAARKWRTEPEAAKTVRFDEAPRYAARNSTGSEQIPFLPRTSTESFSLSETVYRAVEQTPVRPHVAPQDVMNQIVQRLSYTFMNGNEGEIRVFLRPESLGDLQVKVRLEHEVMVAKFVAQSQEVKAIIENNLGQLRDALEQQGIKIGKMVVTTDGGFNNQSSGDQGQDTPGGPASWYSDSALQPETVAAYENSLYGGDELEVGYSRSRVFTTSASQVSYFA